MGLKTRTVKVIKRHLVHGKKCVGAKGFQGIGQKGVMCSPPTLGAGFQKI